RASSGARLSWGHCRRIRLYLGTRCLPDCVATPGMMRANEPQDLHYMKAALRLAAKGRGTTSPNPMVGALVINRGRIIGRGYHLRPGFPHAEVLALRQAKASARGGTLYVTLEPCCHLKKRTAPCVPA